MRQVVLDTETTGLEPSQGHRIIELGCVELINRCRTGKTYHTLVNPERSIEDGAYDVHGINNESLVDKPVFSAIVQELIDFIRDSELIIHNAPFDISFLNAELTNTGKHWGQITDYCQVLDTLALAREKHPGQKNSLDALCKRYGVDNSQRQSEGHGALLDAQILVDVYLLLTKGQAKLTLEQEDYEPHAEAISKKSAKIARNRPKIFRPDRNDIKLHQQTLARIEEAISGPCLWTMLDDNRKTD